MGKVRIDALGEQFDKIFGLHHIITQLIRCARKNNSTIEDNVPILFSKSVGFIHRCGDKWENRSN